MIAVASETATPVASHEPGSFRDRTARVFYVGDVVYRGLSHTALEAWHRTSRSAFFNRAMSEGAIVGTTLVEAPPHIEGLRPAWSAFLHHERIPFVSYPYEWSFGMLKDAAMLHLELLRSALGEDVTMKDGTPFNVQWIGARPVFIDIATFVPWQRGEPWAGYRQFCRSFLYPLMLQAYKGVAFQSWLRGRLEGILADDLRRLMSWRDLFRPGVLTHVVAQSSLEHQLGNTSRNVRSDLRQAGFDKRVLSAMVDRLQRLVSHLDWKVRPSTWSEYVTHNSYDADALRTKEAFVDSAVRSTPRKLVWDLGCNTGRFSNIAAAHSEYVVAIDSDHESIERLYCELQRGVRRNILPLTMDLSDPSPAVGWRTSERRTMIERGRPDLVLCLALVHHLAITANVPVDDIVDWLYECGGDLVVEFPTEQDEMVKRLLRNKDQAYDDYCLRSFEASLAARFDVRERVQLSSETRYLYYATRKSHVDGSPATKSH